VAILPNFGEPEQCITASHRSFSKRRGIKNTHSLLRRAKIYIQKRYSFQRETLELLGILSDERIISGDRVPIISASRLVVPCHNIASGREFPNWVVLVLRERFLPHTADKQKIKGRRIYVSREAARFRRALNEGEIIDLLKQYGFSQVRLENLAFAEQVKLFRDAEIVVGA
jgi:capsular polysaccharide biosynthesis protein